MKNSFIINKVASLFIILLLLFGCQKKQGKHLKPNIIIFFTDDQGYGDVGGIFGAMGFKTPNFDQLQRAGLTLTDFEVPATVCTPSRAALLTGEYSKRLGLAKAVLFPFSKNGLSPKRVYTLAELLRGVGYSTSCIGKWHLGDLPKYMPNNQGFDYFFGVPYSNDMDGYYYQKKDYQSPPLPLYLNTKRIMSGPPQDSLTTWYTEKAIQRIKNRGSKPFFIYLAHTMPHQPLHVSAKFRGKSKKGLYGDVIEELDWSAGQIIKTLKEEGIYRNTVFIFTSDNGSALSQGGSAGPLRGQKATTWEGGHREPAIIVWPAKIPAGTVSNQLVTSLDIYPTLAHIAGASIPEDKILDGIDITKFLQNPETVHLPKRPIFYYARNGKVEVVRYGHWNLHIAKSRGWNDSTKFPVSLYYLPNDIGEKNNVASLFPKRVKKLRKMITDFVTKINGDSSQYSEYLRSQ